MNMKSSMKGRKHTAKSRKVPAQEAEKDGRCEKRRVERRSRGFFLFIIWYLSQIRYLRKGTEMGEDAENILRILLTS
jgi:hypothetical protein